MIHRKTLLFFFILSALFSTAQEQEYKYTFTYRMGTYVPLDLFVSQRKTHAAWEFEREGLALNMDFPFLGSTNRFAAAHNKGLLWFDNMATPDILAYCGGITLKERAPAGEAPVSVMAHTLDFDPDGEVMYKFELRNVGVVGEGDNFINMQVWLYKSGMFELRFGPAKLDSAEWYGGYTGLAIGVASNNNKDVISLLCGLPTAPVLMDQDTNLITYPPVGMIYRFTPVKSGPTALDERQIPSFNVYPNPVADVLHFNIEGNESALFHQPLEITDLTGHRVLYKEELNTTDVDVSDLTPGVYFVRVGTSVKKISKM